MRFPSAKSLTLALLLSAGTALYAQDNASLTGVVTDATGAVVPDTVVILTNPHTGVKFTTKSDARGSYRFPLAPPDPGYTITFQHPGFSAVSVKEFALSVGVTATRNAQLTAGTETMTVEVAGNNAAETINTTDATIGNNIDVQLINDLPVQSRSNVAALFTDQPGYAAGSFTGARSDQNSVTLDGMDTNDIAAGPAITSSGAVVGNAPVDSVQEFRGNVAGLTSNLGTGSGGQFQLVTRSGTNTFHGSVSEYHRDPATVANTWFNKLNGLPKTQLVRNQIGGSIGGPILKDKLFFFFDFLNNRIAQTAPVTRTVPMASYLAGNVNYINNSTGCNSSSRLNTQPQCISTLTPAQVLALDPQHLGENSGVLAFLNNRFANLSGGVFDPTTGDGVNTIGYRFNSPSPDTLYNYVAKVDYNLTPKQRIFARLTIAHEDGTQAASEFLTDPVTSPYYDRSYGYVISHSWNIGSNKVNQVYYGDTISKLNFANLYNPTGTSQFTFSKYSAAFLSGPYLSGSSQRRRIPIPMVRDDFNWQKGNHTITAGGTFKWIKTNSQLVNDFNFATIGYSPYRSVLEGAPATIFRGTGAAYDYAGAFDTVLGSIAEVDTNYNLNKAGQITPQGQGTRRAYRFYQTELYAGDVWKVTPKLTLDYGLRWQIYSTPYEANGLESVQNTTFTDYLKARVAQSTSGASGDSSLPFITYQLGGKANNGPASFDMSWKDVAPRVAFAYAATPKTVINGSAGIVYDRTVINAVDFIQDQSSQFFQQTVSNPYTNGLASGTGGTGNPRVGGTASKFTFPANAPSVITYPKFTPNVSGGTPYGLAANSFNNIIDPNLKTPYSINYNVGVQQEFGNRLVLRINYVGRQGRRLLAQADASQLIDFPDKASGQTLGGAITNLELQARANKTAATVTPVAFFENQIAPGYGVSQGYANNTAYVIDNYGSLLVKGDFADTVQGIASTGALNSNVGMASQFAGNTYLTNMGFSSYNGLLVTLAQNKWHGLEYHLNYTWSHSIDNVSNPANFIASSNGTGFICDVLRPRECRANSDFDITNFFTGDFVYDLPFGRGRSFGSHMPVWLNEVVGGWQVSGLPQYRSGQAFSTSTGAFVAGYANNAPAIFNGMRGDIQIKPHKVGKTLLGYANCASTTNCAAQADFSAPTGFNIGQRNVLRGTRAFYFDAGLAKRFAILPNDRLNLQFRADFFNVLNHPVFANPTSDISQANGLAFGQITAVLNGNSGTGARVGQFSLRLDF